jgi:ankyrin repeat protein
MAAKPKAPRPPEERLLAAARGGQINVLLKILQTEKVDLDAQDHEDNLNSIYHEERGTPAAGREGKSGNTALLWACHLHRTKIALALLDAGADPCIKNIQGETALHLADGEDRLIDKLVDKGGDVNARSNHGTTPLMRATDANDQGKITFLLRHGADPALKDKDGKSAYDRIKSYERTGALSDQLRQAEIKLRNAEQQRKERELHDAVEGATRTSRDITPMQPLKLKMQKKPKR